MKNQGFARRDSSLALGLHGARKEWSRSSSISKQTSHVSPNEYPPAQQANPTRDIQSAPTLNLTSGAASANTRSTISYGRTHVSDPTLSWTAGRAGIAKTI